MKRVNRQPSKFGPVDLADQLGVELNLPLDQVSRQFSFDEATSVATKDTRLMHGRRVERMFEYVVASLGQATLITSEDSGAAVYDGDEIQAPDYFVALRGGQKYLIEVKNRRLKTLHTPVILRRDYLDRLKRYAALKGLPLLLAVYWPNLRLWTINKITDIERDQGGIEITFVHAYQRTLASEFGDRLLMAVPPLTCRLHADRKKASRQDANGEVHFTIERLSFFSEGKEIVNALEREIALYFLFHSSWSELEPTVTFDGTDVEYVEIESTSEDEGDPEQPMKSLGSLAGMISSYYNWLTTADNKITRLTPNVEPGRLASGLDDDYKGEVLRLWQFAIERNDQALLKLNLDDNEV